MSEKILRGNAVRIKVVCLINGVKYLGGDYLKYCLCCAMLMAENNEFCESANEDSVKMMMEFSNT